MDSRYKFPMLCSSQHTTTIIQLIIFVSIGLTSFCSLTADGDKDNELDDSGCVLTKGTGHPMSCLAITFTTQQINSKRRIFACPLI